MMFKMKKLYNIASIEKDYYSNIFIHTLLLLVTCIMLKILFFKEKNTMFIILIFSIGILFLLRKYLKLKQKFKSISNDIRARLNNELKSPILTRDDCILTENNLIILNTYFFDYVPYKDIILIYKKMILNRRNLEQNLCILTKKIKFINFLFIHLQCLIILN